MVNQIRQVIRQIRATWRTVWAAIWRVRRSLIVLLSVLIGGTMVFWLIEGRRFIEALFYTLNLITLQAGPGDAPQSTLLQGVAVFIMVGGLISLTGGVATLFQLISDPKERQLSLAATVSDHIVVCGVGRVGYRVITELLNQGETVVAVNAHEKEEWIEPFRKRGVAFLIANARQRQTLINAGVARAASIVACTSDDLTNLDIVLDARDINPKIKVVMRMFDTKLAEKVSKGFNIQTAFSVSALAAPALAAAAMRYKVDYSFKLRDQLLNVTTVRFVAGSRFMGKTLDQVAQMANCSFISQQKGDQLHLHPSGSTPIKDGDVYNIIGPIAAIQMLQS
jgi:voltage-gated potassium channel